MSRQSIIVNRSEHRPASIWIGPRLGLAALSASISGSTAWPFSPLLGQQPDIIRFGFPLLELAPVGVLWHFPSASRAEQPGQPFLSSARGQTNFSSVSLYSNWPPFGSGGSFRQLLLYQLPKVAKLQVTFLWKAVYLHTYRMKEAGAEPCQHRALCQTSYPKPCS